MFSKKSQVMGPCWAENDLYPLPRPRITFNVGIMLSVISENSD